MVNAATTWDVFGEYVRALLEVVPASGRPVSDADTAFIAAVWRAGGGGGWATLSTVKAWLWEAFRQGEITLRRYDLRAPRHHELADESALVVRGAEYHLVGPPHRRGRR